MPLAHTGDEALRRLGIVWYGHIDLRLEPIHRRHLALAPEWMHSTTDEGNSNTSRRCGVLCQVRTHKVAILLRLAIVQGRRLNNKAAKQTSEHACTHKTA